MIALFAPDSGLVSCMDPRRHIWDKREGGDASKMVRGSLRRTDCDGCGRHRGCSERIKLLLS